ncbi:hypothetical protein LguiB_006142 [Lonicera macranthoides]
MSPTQTTERKNPPPSPKRLPITGNFDQLGSAPHRSLESLARKHGPIMLQQLGGVPVIVASSADLAREIMRTHDLVFSNRPKQSIISRLLYESKDKQVDLRFFRREMFAAGTDTTYTVLEWTVSELLWHPEIMKKLQNEIREIAKGKSKITKDDLDKMQYLKLVIKETNLQ